MGSTRKVSVAGSIEMDVKVNIGSTGRNRRGSRVNNECRVSQDFQVPEAGMMVRWSRRCGIVDH